MHQSIHGVPPGQAVTIIQQLGIVSLIRVDWAHPMLSVLDFVATVAFFDVQDPSLATGCLCQRVLSTHIST